MLVGFSWYSVLGNLEEWVPGKILRGRVPQSMKSAYSLSSLPAGERRLSCNVLQLKLHSRPKKSAWFQVRSKNEKKLGKYNKEEA